MSGGSQSPPFTTIVKAKRASETKRACHPLQIQAEPIYVDDVTEVPILLLVYLWFVYDSNSRTYNIKLLALWSQEDAIIGGVVTKELIKPFM